MITLQKTVFKMVLHDLKCKGIVAILLIKIYNNSKKVRMFERKKRGEYYDYRNKKEITDYDT